MPETSVAIVSMPLGIAILTVGWAVALGLYLLGVGRRRPAWTGLGLIGAGIMVLVTFALLELTTLPAASRGFDVSLEDLLVLGLAGFLGGALAMLGASYIRLGASRVHDAT